MFEYKVSKIKAEISLLCEFFLEVVNNDELIYRTGYTSENVLIELNSIKDNLNQKNSLTIAFVGEYSSGKTTIINILTGENLTTSTNVETSKSVKIDWLDYKIIDTPGLGSGLKNHDEITKKWLAKADLLIYVLTPDLFNSNAGERFFKILNNYNRKQELMLVMNMIDQEGNNIDTYKDELQSVIEPIPLNDFYPTFISAKYFNDSIKAEGIEDKNYYKDKSLFKAFLNTLDSFLMNRKQKSILSTPLTRLYSISQIFTINSSFNKEIELISQKIDLFSETKTNIDEIELLFSSELDSFVSETAGEIYRALDTPPKNFKKFVEEEFNKFTNNLTDSIKDLTNSLSNIIGDFEVSNKQIDNSRLAQDVYERIKNSEVLKDIFENITGNKFKTNNKSNDNFFEDFINQAKNINNKHGGANENFIKDLLSSKDLFQLSTQLIGKIDKKIILDIGHKIGHKFKPWEALKLASKIGKAVPYINIASSVWDVGSHYFKKRKEKKVDKELREFKESIKDFLNKAIKVTSEMTKEDLIKPISNNFENLRKVYNLKKVEMIEHSQTNVELAKQLEQKREYCLSLHNEIYENK